MQVLIINSLVEEKIPLSPMRWWELLPWPAINLITSVTAISPSYDRAFFVSAGNKTRAGYISLCMIKIPKEYNINAPHNTWIEEFFCTAMVTGKWHESLLITEVHI